MMKVSIRALIFGLIWPLVFVPALAEESGPSTADSAGHFHLTGVLVSGSGRSALINNRVFREGDRVAGFEILAIREGTVQILMGSQELTVRVGGTAVWDPSSHPVTRGTRQSSRPRIPTERVSTVATTHSPAPAIKQPNSRYGPVMHGETLSEIAERHLTGDISMNQMMIALFDANPEAFGGNINELREGVVLHIPDEDALQHRAPEVATAEVLRQVHAWQNRDQQAVQLAKRLDAASYGPVRSGETLSAIAVRLSMDGSTMNQMMIALFDANPDAFGGNINVLREGAVLRIPDEDELHHRAPAIAAAEVLRHMDAWRPDPRRQLQSASVQEDVNASHQDRYPPLSDVILLSMTSSE